MRLLNPPKSNYTSYYLKGAFDLTWRYNAVLIICFLLVIIAGGLVNFNLFLLGLLSWVLPLFSLFILKTTGKFELIAYLHVVLGSIVTGANIVFYQHYVLVPSIVFMMVTVFYAFITLRRKVGIASLVVQFIWLVIFIFKDHSVSAKASFLDKLSITLILITALLLFSFLIIEFLKLRKNAEKKYVAINEDLTEVNYLVNLQYQEKTVMLKEIHHRVKNNLQVISSLLRLQSYEIKEESSQILFQDAINRVSAMALIHEKMYQNENLSQINLKNYIQTLSTDLIRSYSPNTDIELKISSDIQELGNDTLVPVALILNELITNSLKHAFTDKSSGLIDVSIIKSKREGYFMFVYRDGGEWKARTNDSSFGLELISTLTEQLDGKVERTYDNGTKYVFNLRDLK